MLGRDYKKKSKDDFFTSLWLNIWYLNINTLKQLTKSDDSIASRNWIKICICRYLLKHNQYDGLDAVLEAYSNLFILEIFNLYLAI